MASFRKLPSGKWQAAVWHPSGKRFTRTDPLKRVVVEWANDLEASVRRGDFVDPNAGKMTLGDWWRQWSSTRLVQKATASKRESLWRVHLEPAFGRWPLASIQPWDIEKWIAEMAGRGVGPEAAASAVRLLKQLLAAAVKHRLLRLSPADVVDTPASPKHDDRILSDEEVDRLLANITMPGPRAGVRRGEPRPRVLDEENRLFVSLMLFGGLRWEEAAGQHGFRVDLKRRQLRVREVVERGRTIKPMPKSAAGERDVPLLEDELVEPLRVHIARVGRDGLLFTEADGGPLDYSNWLKRVWQPAVAAADLARPLPTPHDCRHTYGTMLAEEGIPPHEIAALMGHSSLRAVERYMHARSVRMSRARDALYARRAHGGGGAARSPASRDSGNGA